MAIDIEPGIFFTQLPPPPNSPSDPLVKVHQTCFSEKYCANVGSRRSEVDPQLL